MKSGAKIKGACSCCDIECFEIVSKVDGKPHRLGPPLAHAHRATFLLINGSHMDLTMCDECLVTLTPDDYPKLWQRVMASWVAESGPKHDGVTAQANNGIMGLRSSQLWRDVK